MLTRLTADARCVGISSDDITLPDSGEDDEFDSDLVTVDEQRGTARTDVIGLPAEQPLDFDLGLVVAPVEPEPTTTPAPEVTTTVPPTTAAPTTEAPTTTTPPPTTVAPTTSAAPPTTTAIAATTTAATDG